MQVTYDKEPREIVAEAANHPRECKGDIKIGRRRSDQVANPIERVR